jgi:hypothetical protein
MTEKRDDGGPAFPLETWISDEDGQFPYPYSEDPGMTLLDWFAGHALAGLVAGQTPGSEFDLARHSYDQAAAMIAEKRRREAGEPKP